MSKLSNKKSSLPTLPSLSHKEALILGMLISSAKELYGLEMVEASEGELKRGTIYVTLLRMKEKGYVESRPEPRPIPEVGIARRLYKATGYGERVFAAYEAAHTIIKSDFAVANT